MHDPPRQALGGIAVDWIAQDNAELIAAESSHRSAFGNPRQAPGDHLEHLVAQPVAVDVVDRLEIVEVQHEERAGLALGKRPGPFVEILDEPAAVGKAGEHVVARELIGLGLSLAPLGDLKLQIDGAADRVDLGGEAEEDDQQHQPVDLVVLRLVGQLDELVERVVPDGNAVDREPDRSHDNQVPHDAALPRVPIDATLNRPS